MELLYSRALDMNGGVDYSDEDGENSIYKQKYERAMKELEFTKRRLQQQHEDDMEQLMGLKKQLEKKVGTFVDCLMYYNSIRIQIPDTQNTKTSKFQIIQWHQMSYILFSVHIRKPQCERLYSAIPKSSGSQCPALGLT